MLILPTRTNIPHYEFEIELDGVSVRLEFRWNDREAAWFFDVLELDASPILQGRKVVLGLPLLGRFADARLPTGDLIAIDTAGTNVEPGIDELGTRVRLCYATAAELAAG